LLLILLLPFAIGKDIAYSDWVYNNQTLTLDGAQFHMLIGNDGHALIVKEGDMLETIPLDACGSIRQREICFNASVYMRESKDYKAFVDIYYVKSAVTIDRTITNNILKIGEKATFETVIRNTGTEAIRGLRYVEEFPKAIVIDSVHGACDMRSSSVVWEGNLAPGAEESCEYTIYAQDIMDTTIRAAAYYNNGFTDEIAYSGTIRMYATPVLAINFTSVRDRMQISQMNELWINITNTETEDIRIDSFELEVPSGLTVVETGLTKEEGLYGWHGTIKPGETRKLFMKVSGKLRGTWVLQGTMEYEYDGIAFVNQNIKKQLTVEEMGLEINQSIPNNHKIEANQDLLLRIRAKNLNEFADMKDARFTAETALFSIQNRSILLLDKNRTTLIHQMEASVPDVNTTTVYPITINISYSSPFGERFSRQVVTNVIVEPIKKLVIKQTLSSETVEEDGYVTVKVDVLNQRNMDVQNVLISDLVPSGLVIEGPTSSIIDLAQEQEKTAYTYRIKAPIVINDTLFEINTTARYSWEEKSYLFMSSKTLKVKPRTLRIAISKNPSQPSAYLGELVPVKYIIENNEQDPGYGLVLFATEHEFFDTVNFHNYTLKELSPAERIVIEKEFIRPKKAGSHTIDGSILSYDDVNGRSDDITSASFAFEAKEGKIQGPAIMLRKNVAEPVVFAGNITLVTLSVENIGSEGISSTITDNGEAWSFDLAPGQMKNLSYFLRFDEEGEEALPRAHAYYSYLGSDLRAVSNIVKVLVKHPSDTIDLPEEEIVELNSTALNESQAVITEEKGPNIFQRFISWIKGLFRRS